MLVSEYLEIVYEEIDKEGMPYFEEAELIKRMRTATYLFLEEAIPYLQINQKSREDLGMLTIPFSINTNVGGLFSFTNNFYRLVSLVATFGTKTRSLPIVQSNDFEKLKDDPFNSPTAESPLAEFYQNAVKVEPLPDNVKGLYLKHPTFGLNTNDELIEELPIQIQLFLIEKVVLHLMTTIGDQRFQMQYYQVGKKNTDS